MDVNCVLTLEKKSSISRPSISFLCLLISHLFLLSPFSFLFLYFPPTRLIICIVYMFDVCMWVGLCVCSCLYAVFMFMCLLAIHTKSSVLNWSGIDCFVDTHVRSYHSISVLVYVCVVSIGCWLVVRRSFVKFLPRHLIPPLLPNV